MAKASDVSPQPAMVRSPKIVENQCGSSDMIQSVEAKVTVSTRNSSPGALTFRNLIESIVVTPTPRSCSADHLLRIQTSASQNTK